MGLDKAVPAGELVESRLSSIFYLALASGMVYAGLVVAELAAGARGLPDTGVAGALAWVMYLGATICYGCCLKYGQWVSGRERGRAGQAQVLLGTHVLVLWTGLLVASVVLRSFGLIPRLPAGLMTVAVTVFFFLVAVGIVDDICGGRMRHLDPEDDDLRALLRYYSLSRQFGSLIMCHVEHYGFITPGVCAEKFGMDGYDAKQMLHIMEFDGDLFRTKKNGMMIYVEPVYRLAGQPEQEEDFE